MLGELNTSHFGFNTFGQEDSEYYGSRTLETGILFSKDNPFTVSKIVSKSPADVTGKNIRIGDELVAVNGKIIDKKLNRESYFSEPSIDNEMHLTFKRNNETINLNIHPISSGRLRTLLYDEWVANNQSYTCLLYTSPSPRDQRGSRMPSSA